MQTRSTNTDQVKQIIANFSNDFDEKRGSKWGIEREGSHYCNGAFFDRITYAKQIRAFHRFLLFRSRHTTIYNGYSQRKLIGSQK